MFVVTLRKPREPIVGRVALTALVRGPFQCAHLGYWVDVAHERQGLTSEAVEQVVAFASSVCVCTACKRRSCRTTPRAAGSREEPISRRGFCQALPAIGGQWEDHLLYGLTVEEWRPVHEGEHDAKLASLSG